MTDDQTTTVVLQDGAGHYYLITPEMLAAARVSEEHAAKIESLLAESDTTGFMPLPTLTPELVPGSGLRIAGLRPSTVSEAVGGHYPLAAGGTVGGIK